MRCPKCGYKNVTIKDKILYLENFYKYTSEDVYLVTLECNRCHFKWKELQSEEELENEI